MKKQILSTLVLVFTMSLTAQNIKLPTPQKTGGMPLMEALNKRKTQRAFSEKPLSQQQLSNLLWAASGVNREDGRMTAPTASNNQQIEIFVALKDAVYQYLPQTHELKFHLKGDHRKAFGMQPFVEVAPVVLAFISNQNKMAKYPDAAKLKYGYTDTGNVSQNVYLFCASEGLATVVLGRFDAELLSKTIQLEDFQKPILTQPVGFPK